MAKHILRLYVSGQTDRSQRAIASWRQFCENEFAGIEHNFEVIDIVENPGAAEEAKIFATPTFIKHQPPPVRRIIGELADREKVLRMLNISEIERS